MDLASRVEAIDWYHSIKLPGGLVTPGVNNSPVVLGRLELPMSLAGKTVLDIGAWDGFYSFEAARRGAARVLATDSFVWQGRWGQGGFNLARTALGLEHLVEDRTIDVMDLSPESLGDTYDVVLFLGVLYHLPDPIGALQRVASVTRGTLCLETETALNYLPFPAARLWPRAELKGDDTNWWSINAAGLVAALKSLGFRDVRVVWRTSLARRVGRAIKTRGSFRENVKSQRLVLHATR
jgi:tRNA (mo5U34)-methyltransferase